jgi:hypothetical protein
LRSIVEDFSDVFGSSFSFSFSLLLSFSIVSFGSPFLSLIKSFFILISWDLGLIYFFLIILISLFSFFELLSKVLFKYDISISLSTSLVLLSFIFFEGSILISFISLSEF